MRSAPSKQNDYLSEQIKENIKQSKINEHETPFDEILYDLFSVGESVDKQSRALTRKSRTKLLYLFSTYGRTFVFSIAPKSQRENGNCADLVSAATAKHAIGIVRLFATISWISTEPIA